MRPKLPFTDLLIVAITSAATVLVMSLVVGFVMFGLFYGSGMVSPFVGAVFFGFLILLFGSVHGYITYKSMKSKFLNSPLTTVRLNLLFLVIVIVAPIPLQRLALVPLSYVTLCVAYYIANRDVYNK